MSELRTNFLYPLEDRFVQVQVGQTKLINLQIVAWLRQYGYRCGNDGYYLYFETEEILMHFVMVWSGLDKFKEYWGEEGVRQMMEADVDLPHTV